MNNTCQFDQATCYLNHPAGEAQRQGPPPTGREDFRIATPPHPPDPLRNQKPLPAQQQTHGGLQEDIKAMAAAMTTMTSTVTSAMTSMASTQAVVLQAIQALLQKGPGPVEPSS